MDKEITAVRLENLVWKEVSAMLEDEERLKRAYEQAKQQDHAAHARSRALLEEYYRSLSKLEQQLINLDRMYTDPDINMKKSAYLLQKDQFEKEKKEIQEKIEKIEKLPSNLPTEGEFEDLLEFSKKVRAKIANEDWDPTPQSKRRLLEMLHIKVVLSKDGTGKVEGWFGESSGFLYTES